MQKNPAIGPKMILAAIFFTVSTPLSIFAQQTMVPGRRDTGSQVLLSNGWSLSPAGRSFPLGDLPLNIAVSRSKKYLAVTNNGQSTQSIQLIDAREERVLDSVNIGKSWLGLVFSGDGKYLYASGGNDNRILQYSVGSGRLLLSDSIELGRKWPEKISPAGMDIDDRTNRLYVVTRENNSLYVIDLATKTILKRVDLGGEAYTCRLAPGGKELYVSCWGADKILVFETGKLELTASIPVGDNPNDIEMSHDGHWLFVANANDNSVSVIDLKNRKLTETLNAALYAGAPPGSTTNALALSRDDKTLYIANADNNCLAVFDVSKPGASLSKGFIPVGWYPTAVKVIDKKIFVANGKGFSSMANPYGPNPVNKKQIVTYQQGDLKKEQPVQYIAGLFKGTMSIIDQPDDKQLATWSQQVYSNTPYSRDREMLAPGETGNPIPMRAGEPSPIKYVFYVIKENRTYDQILGDISEGNGDSSLVLFGEKVTPNLHSLARQFVLLDNFYVDAEVSADGHNWSMGGYATDYLEKTWPTYYGGRGGSYDGEGNREIANNKGGFIWDHCIRAGVSCRTYGEFADNSKPNLKSLKGHFSPTYSGWNLGVRDTTRVGQWKKEFDSLLAANAVPHLNTVRLGNDHTEGMKKGRPSPYAHVADNDLAVGEFVDYLSKSPIWNETAVFILEDDAQNGADHIDAHRSPVYLAGGLVKRHYVDHTMYSTTSVLRTIELILGIKPMTQYDAAAMPMWRCFNNTPDAGGFTALPANIDLNDKNIAWNEMARMSENLDLAREDRVPDDLFNLILWKGIRGMDAVVPAPRHAAFVKPVAKKDDDD